MTMNCGAIQSASNNVCLLHCSLSSEETSWPGTISDLIRLWSFFSIPVLIGLRETQAAIHIFEARSVYFAVLRPLITL